MPSHDELSFSTDIRTHVDTALRKLLTLDTAKVTAVNTVARRVNVEVEVYDEANNIVAKLPLKNLFYLVNTIVTTDTAGHTASTASYIPKVGDRVVVAYVEKSMNRAVVIGKIGI